MSTTKTKCQLVDCQRVALAYCFCCQNNVCANHLLEHIENMKTNVEPLVSQVKRMMERVENLSIEHFSRPAFAQLDQWRTETYELIDELHQTKTEEVKEELNKNEEKLDAVKRQQSNALMKLQVDVKQLVDDGDIAFERLESSENRLREIGTSLDDFEKKFLLIDSRIPSESLVTVSSRLNQPSEPVKQTKPTENVKLGTLLFDYENTHHVSFLEPKTPPHPKASSSEQPKPFTSNFSFGESNNTQAQSSAPSFSFTSNPSASTFSNAAPSGLFSSGFSGAPTAGSFGGSSASFAVPKTFSSMFSASPPLVPPTIPSGSGPFGTGSLFSFGGK